MGGGVGAGEAVKFTNDFLHYSQRHFGVPVLASFRVLWLPRVPLYPSVATYGRFCQSLLHNTDYRHHAH